MKIEQIRQGSVEVVTVVDTVTEDEAEELRTVVESAVHANAGRVILNMTRTPYVDSRGLEALLACAESCRLSGRRLKLVGVADTLREIFEITDLEPHFEFFPDIEHAIRSYLSASAREASDNREEAAVPLTP